MKLSQQSVKLKRNMSTFFFVSSITKQRVDEGIVSRRSVGISRQLTNKLADRIYYAESWQTARSPRSIRVLCIYFPQNGSLQAAD